MDGLSAGLFSIDKKWLLSTIRINLNGNLEVELIFRYVLNFQIHANLLLNIGISMQCQLKFQIVIALIYECSISFLPTQTIDEVYLDHLNTSKSGRPHCTFIVKTKRRSYTLQAASDAAARIWIDAIITGAQGNLDY